MYGKRAEGVMPYLHKGRHVTIDGHLRQERWEKDGQKRSKLKLIVDEIDFTGGRGDRDEAEGATADEPADEAPSAVYDDDIPF